MKKTSQGWFYGVMVLTVVVAFAFAVPTQAGDKPADNMEILKEKLKSDKKLIIAENMQLTESEAKGFWPVYQDYQKALDRLGDRTLKMLGEYAENYGAMSESAARKLLDDFLAIEADYVLLMQSYLPRFRKVLPDKKVARYYQLENKIDALINYGLAARIPLVQ
jgi:hypothetical protein